MNLTGIVLDPGYVFFFIGRVLRLFVDLRKLTVNLGIASPKHLTFASRYIS
jgi:hypothetical protein